MKTFLPGKSLFYESKSFSNSLKYFNKKFKFILSIIFLVSGQGLWSAETFVWWGKILYDTENVLCNDREKLTGLIYKNKVFNNYVDCFK